MSFPLPVLVNNLTTALSSQDWDAVIYISDKALNNLNVEFSQIIQQQAEIDQRVGGKAVLIASQTMPGKRLIFVPTGTLNREYDDVRRIFDAAIQAADLASQSGAVKPLLMVDLDNNCDKYKNAVGVAFLGMCQSLWQPLEAREHLGEQNVEPVDQVGLFLESQSEVDWLTSIESGKRVARDLCGTDPERMSPPQFAHYCQQVFEGSDVSVSVMEDNKQILTQYPLLHAVARASVEVARHQPRVIRLEYVGDGDIEQTLYFAGKGITFDTGGADLKVGGHMAGMSRDKGGAAAVAGFMQVVAALKPKGLKVVAEIGAVRNSIGADAFVPDEIIVGHSGKRVRVGNTDAEGRMVLADILSHLRVEAVDAINPQLFSVATLTGHAAIAFGPYTALVENGPALSINTANSIAEAGEKWADTAEQSRSRREDFAFIQPRTKADDVLSSNNAPSVGTPRGHQFPMAFLAVASGLANHGSDSQSPLPFTHIDIAGSGVENGDWQHGKPTAAPVAALAAHFLS